MIAVLDGGLQTTVQDYPGRVGYWNIGIPPSGPMDPLAFRLANKLVGNSKEAAGLEITATGPKLLFMEKATIALTGARMEAMVGQSHVPMWESIEVKKGDILTVGALQGAGFRSYLAISGGIDAPKYLGSRSTFPYGRFGGFEGRAIAAGDLLSIDLEKTAANKFEATKLDESLIPVYENHITVGVVPGPHEAPDFFTYDDVELFYNTDWQVHHNSNRLGYRLQGPRMKFERKDGGEGGRHPSNIHDCAYAIGTLNFTGDMPIILAVDGPSLGGFVSIATIATAEFWKIGQAAGGNKLRFKKISHKEAIHLRWMQEKMISEV